MTSDVPNGEVQTSEDRFFSLLETQATLVEQGARLLYDALREGREAAKVRDALKSVEQECDDRTHDLFLALNAAVLRPQDRGSIARLARALDDVLDFSYATVNHLHLYEIDAYPEPLVTTAGLLAEQAALLREVVPKLREVGAREGVEPSLVRVHELENRADEVTNAAKAALFHEDDVKLILKMKDIYEYLEEATDKCEDAADVIRDIFVRHGY